MDVMQAKPCETAEAFAGRMLVECWLKGAPVKGRFNQHEFIASYGMTAAQVMRPLTYASYLSRFGKPLPE